MGTVVSLSEYRSRRQIESKIQSGLHFTQAQGSTAKRILIAALKDQMEDQEHILLTDQNYLHREAAAIKILELRMRILEIEGKP